MAGPGKSFAGPAWNATSSDDENLGDGTTTANGTTSSTAAMVQKVSKHRSHWERPKSPPGFWRSDFPTTQETAEEKRQAAERLKQEARNRFNEVIQGGGKEKSRFMFRDVALRERVFEMLQ